MGIGNQENLKNNNIRMIHFVMIAKLIQPMRKLKNFSYSDISKLIIENSMVDFGDGNYKIIALGQWDELSQDFGIE